LALFDQLWSIILFDRDTLTWRAMYTFLNNCIGSTADLLAKMVDAKIRAAGRGEIPTKIFRNHAVRGRAGIVRRTSETIVVITPVVEEGEATGSSGMLLLRLLE